MSADQEYSGDYTYDLAHEVKASLDGVHRPRALRSVPVSALPFEVDPHGDLGYDSAHEG